MTLGNHNAYISYTLKNWNEISYRAHLAWSLYCESPNFVTFNLGFILSYPIDLICLALVVNGGQVSA